MPAPQPRLTEYNKIDRFSLKGETGMGLKVLGGVIVGIVLGAAVAEVLQKKNPELIAKIEQKVRNSLKAVKDAFKEGYVEATGVPAEAKAE